MNKEIETITISKREYEELLEADLKLNCLENWGVDNWCGWGEAMQEFNDMKDYKDE